MTGCVLDTDIVIAALDRRDAHHEAAAEALESMVGGEVLLMLSTVNYAEALVRPAEDEQTLRAAVGAISALGIKLIAPTPAMARDAARRRSLGISLAEGFAIATAEAQRASLATFDRRVRRALETAGVALAAPLA